MLQNITRSSRSAYLFNRKAETWEFISRSNMNKNWLSSKLGRNISAISRCEKKNENVRCCGRLLDLVDQHIYLIVNPVSVRIYIYHSFSLCTKTENTNDITNHIRMFTRSCDQLFWQSGKTFYKSTRRVFLT